MKHPFYNLGLVNKLAFRLGRVQALVWTLVLAGMSFAYIPTYGLLFPTASERLAAAALFDLPATKVFAGPGFGLSTTNTEMNAPLPGLSDGAGHVTDILIGPLALGKLYLTILICLAIMSIFFIVRLTRGQEESGLSELIRSNRVGNKVQMLSALIFTIALNAVISIAVSLAFILGGMWIRDSIAVGLGCFLCGTLFAALAALFSELCEHARTARLLSVAVVFIAFAIGALGNAESTQGSLMTWLSPFQWAFLTRPFAGVIFAPLTFYFPLILILLVAAFLVNSKRDLGAGVIQSQKGRSSASSLLRGIFTFQLRSQRVLFISFALLVSVFGVMFSSMSSNLGGILKDNPMMNEMLASGAVNSEEMTAGIYSTSLLFSLFIIAIYAIITLGSLASDEAKGLSEYILSTRVSKFAIIGKQILFTLSTSVLLLILGGVSLYSSGAKYGVLELAQYAIQRIPCLLLIVGVASLLFAINRRLYGVIWAYYGYGLIASMFADLFNLPKSLIDALRTISPFSNLSGTPLATFDPEPFAIMSITGILFMLAAGFIYRKRDVS